MGSTLESSSAYLSESPNSFARSSIEEAGTGQSQYERIPEYEEEEVSSGSDESRLRRIDDQKCEITRP